MCDLEPKINRNFNYILLHNIHHIERKIDLQSFSTSDFQTKLVFYVNEYTYLMLNMIENIYDFETFNIIFYLLHNEDYNYMCSIDANLFYSNNKTYYEKYLVYHKEYTNKIDSIYKDNLIYLYRFLNIETNNDIANYIFNFIVI